MARLCQVLPIKHVAAFFGLGWDAVKAIDKRHLMDTLGAIDLSGVSILAMDEFAIHKGHRYATVIIDPTIKKVLWVGLMASGQITMRRVGGWQTLDQAPVKKPIDLAA